MNVSLPLGSTVALFLATIDIQSKFGIGVGSSPLSLQPSYPARTLKIGGADIAATLGILYVSNITLNLMQTTNTLTFGGINTNTIVVDGVAYTGTASVVQLWTQLTSVSPQLSSILFMNGSSMFVQALDIRSTGTVEFATNVSAATAPTVWTAWPVGSWWPDATGGSVGWVSVQADSDCDTFGNVVIGVNCGVYSSHTPMSLQMHDYVATTTGFTTAGLLSAGTNQLSLSTCATLSAARVIELGDGGPGTGALKISQVELGSLYGAVLNLRTLGAGSFNVYSVTQPFWDAVIPGTILLDASGALGTVTFNSPTVWGALTVRAGNGITAVGNAVAALAASITTLTVVFNLRATVICNTMAPPHLTLYWVKTST